MPTVTEYLKTVTRDTAIHDQTIGKTQAAGVKASTIGSVQQAATAQRDATAGSSQRAAKNTSNPNATFKTKYAGEIAAVSIDAVLAIDTLSKVKKIGDALEAAAETSTVPPELIAQFTDAFKKATAALASILERTKAVAGKVDAERAEFEAAPTDEGGEELEPEVDTAGLPVDPSNEGARYTGDAALIAAELRIAVGKKRAIVKDARAMMGLPPAPVFNEDVYQSVRDAGIEPGSVEEALATLKSAGLI